MRKHWLLLAAAATFLLPGCFQESFREEDPSLEVNKEELLLRAGTGAGEATDTLFVTSNRSWTVFPSGNEDWLSLPEEGFENPAGVRKTTPLAVICRANPNDAERSTSIVIVGAGQQKTVSVRQKGLKRVDGMGVTGIDNYSFEDYGTK